MSEGMKEGRSLWIRCATELQVSGDKFFHSTLQCHVSRQVFQATSAVRQSYTLPGRSDSAERVDIGPGFKSVKANNGVRIERDRMSGAARPDRPTPVFLTGRQAVRTLAHAPMPPNTIHTGDGEGF